MRLNSNLTAGEEVLDILKERVSYGVRPGAIDESLLFIVSGMCNGDARVGLHILRSAAREAELKNHDALTIEEIKNASKSARKYRLSHLLGNLNEHQRLIYDILKKNGSMGSGDLFNEYCKVAKENVVDRSYRNYMQRMEEFGLVKESGSGRWKKYEIVV